MKRIHRKYTPLVFGFLMSSFMSCLMSFIITFYHVGMHDKFISIWLNTLSVAFVVAFPTVLVVAPIVRRLVARIVDVGP